MHVFGSYKIEFSKRVVFDTYLVISAVDHNVQRSLAMLVSVQMGDNRMFGA